MLKIKNCFKLSLPTESEVLTSYCCPARFVVAGISYTLAFLLFNLSIISTTQASDTYQNGANAYSDWVADFPPSIIHCREYDNFPKLPNSYYPVSSTSPYSLCSAYSQSIPSTCRDYLLPSYIEQASQGRLCRTNPYLASNCNDLINMASRADNCASYISNYQNSAYASVCGVTYKWGSSYAWFMGFSGTWIDENGSSHQLSASIGNGLCNGCPRNYLMGDDGRCHAMPSGCSRADIIGNTIVCKQCPDGYKSDGAGGCASNSTPVSSNTVFSSCSYGSGSMGYYYNAQGKYTEGMLCANTGCPEKHIKGPDGLCYSAEHLENCAGNQVQVIGSIVSCYTCNSSTQVSHAYGRDLSTGSCKPIPSGCAQAYYSNDYTNCQSCKSGFSDPHKGCTQCTNGKLYKDGTCVDSCGDGYYEAYGRCVKNPDDCASYNYGTGSCSDCSEGNYLDGNACKPNPEGCASYNGTSCDVCSGGYLEKNGSCINAENGCGSGYKDMGGFCNRVRWTPAEAAAVLNDDNTNVVTITFKK